MLAAKYLQKFNTFIHDPSSHFTENLQVTVVCETFTNLGITKGSHLAAMKDADARGYVEIRCFSKPGLDTTWTSCLLLLLVQVWNQQGFNPIVQFNQTIAWRMEGFPFSGDGKAEVASKSQVEVNIIIRRKACSGSFILCFTFQRQNMIILVSSSAKGAVVIIWRLRSIQSRTFHDHPWPTTRRQPLLHLCFRLLLFRQNHSPIPRTNSQVI